MFASSLPRIPISKPRRALMSFRTEATTDVNVSTRAPRRAIRHVSCRACGMPLGWAWLIAAALIASSTFPRSAVAQTFFYNEVVKGDRIYVFASSSRYDAFVKSDGADLGPVIERPGYGPGSETVIFDSG